MLIKYRAGEEAFAAFRTTIRPFLCVTFPNVIVKVRANCEASKASGFAARKWFDSYWIELDSASSPNDPIATGLNNYLGGIASAGRDDSTVCNLFRRPHTSTFCTRTTILPRLPSEYAPRNAILMTALFLEWPCIFHKKFLKCPWCDSNVGRSVSLSN